MMETSTTAGTKSAGNLVRDFLNRRTGALRFADEAHDLAEQAIGTETVGAHEEAAGCVESSAGDAALRDFLDGKRFASDHGFVNGRMAFGDDAIDGDGFAGPHAEDVADFDLVYGDFSAVREAGGFGREIQERLEGAGGFGTGAEFENLAEQNKRDDDSGRFKIHGQVFEEANDAENVSGARAEPDQGEHVAVTVFDGSPGALEERCAAPKNDGCGESEGKPINEAHGRPIDIECFEQHQDQKWSGECGADDEATPHIVVLGVVCFGGGIDGFECHAALGATAGAHLANLGVHGAGVFDLGTGASW